MELKELPISKVYANWFQPRKDFEKEKIKDLAESILSNGLLMPITVKKWRDGKYLVCMGERRWRAHKVAKLKTIQAFVKEYKSDGQFMVESLIENIHRDNLKPLEKATFLSKIKKASKIESNYKLSKLVQMPQNEISSLLSMLPYSKQILRIRSKDQTTLGEISQLPDKKTRDILFKKLEEGESTRKIHEAIPIIKKATPEVKEALLSDDITTEQAKRITKLPTEKARDKAINEHKTLATAHKVVETKVEHEMSAREKREFDKRLVQASTWISGFRGNVTESHRQLEKTFKFLITSTKFIPMMDDKQKGDLEHHLGRLIAVLDKGKQLAEQIQEQI